MLLKSSFRRNAVLSLFVFAVLLGAAWAQKESVLYSFCEQTNCPDGWQPMSDLVFDQHGNLYGTTIVGGAFGDGAVFKLTPEGKETVLHSFCTQTNCADGYNPEAGLILDQKGNLYGTTFWGGAGNCPREYYGCGVVFKLTPEGKYTVLYNFCSQSNCADGSGPQARLIFDQKGNLYGTTSDGGDLEGGVVFKLTPNGKYTVLYKFCQQTNCSDGEWPTAGLVLDQKGNLYGTTIAGGAYRSNCIKNICGTIFRLTPKGKETVLYSFCAQAPCSDGAWPQAGLIFDDRHNLYGTTQFGGAYGNGTVFKLTPKGKETVLYDFCQQGYPCADGALPVAGLIFDQNGNLYGTTQSGGASQGTSYPAGAVFKLTPKGKETVLYSFCAQNNCTDGAGPQAGVVFDQKGNLFGSTLFGGAYKGGVLFKLTP